VLLVIVVFAVPGLEDYTKLIAIMSVGIIFNTLGVSWVYKAYEEYVYIMIVGFITQVLSVLLIFICVKQPEDYYRYAVIWNLSYIIPGILNYIRLHKFIKLKLVFNNIIFRHLKPVLILFASSIASTIYLSSDTTILGYISGDYYTGLYGVSSRIYGIIKNILIAALTVSVPRFSYYFNNNMKKDYSQLLEDIQGVMLLLVFPMAIGIYVLSNEVILLLFGKGYLDSTITLKILSIAIPFCMLAWISSQCILIPTKRESLILKSTIVGGAINIILNIILIPYFKHNAAAFTTLISEGTVAIIYICFTKEYWKIKEVWIHAIQCMAVALLMGLEVYLLKKVITGYLIVKLCICVIVGAVTYFGLLLMLKNKILISYANNIKNRIKQRV
jgi:O-antigen/teichoic acid export membrane protein